jgi:hypothetical protein
MNAFEQIVSDVFQSDGYWTKPNYKLVLNPQEKRRIKRKSIPTIDIDIVAYKPGSILLIECKSYLGSSGVHYKDLFKNGNWASHYKIFTRKTYREVILKALKKKLIERKMATRKDVLQLCLVAGNVAGGEENEAKINAEFKKRKWLFIGPAKLREKLLGKREEKIWEDNPVTVTVKLLN